MGRTKGSKNKPKPSAPNGTLTIKNKKIAKALTNHPRNASAGIPLPADYVEVGSVVAIRSHGFHDITCSADPAKPMGCEGCSCEMYRRAKKAEAELEKIKAFLETEYPTILIDAFAGQNKPLPAPKIENRRYIPKNEHDPTLPAKNASESKPKELSNFMKARQNAKNGIK